MTLDELKIFIAQSEIVKIIDFVSSNRDKLKLFFSNIDVLTRETNICIEIIILLNRLNKQLKSDPEIQFLFTNLAFYFKKANKSAYVTTCINNLDNSILKNRLQAWHQYKTYTLKSSHINRFEDYLSKLTNAVSDEKEEYLDDILQDLHTYYSENSHNSTFQELFNNENLLSRYSLLRYYQKIRSSLEYRIELHEHVDKIYTPSIFSEQLFNDKFINYIRYHTDTKWNQILLGYEKFVVRSEVIKYGQANFDDSYKNLTKEDVVKLYCYFNMRKHYYSSLYLFERCSWLKKLIAQEGCTKFIDIGCGPATSGVALIDYLISDNNHFVPFDYIGIDFYQSMLDAASDIMNNSIYKKCSDQTYLTNLKSIDTKSLLNANAILINTCYLFASPNLDVEDLVNGINDILQITDKKPRFLLFQNTTDSIKNVKYNNFKNKLISHEILLSEKLTIRYNNQRNSFYPPVNEQVYFEVLKF